MRYKIAYLSLLTFLLIFQLCCSEDNDEQNIEENANFNSITNNTTDDDAGMGNLTLIYEELLVEVSKYCFTKREFEELYGNKSRFGVVSLIAPFLIDAACEQLGLNELRRHFNLKPKSIIGFNDGPINEEFVESFEGMQNYEPLLKYFQATANDYGVGREVAEGKFDPAELVVAEKFIDEKLPEIRQLYKLKYDELEIDKKVFSAQTVRQMLRGFVWISSKIRTFTRISIKNSRDGFEDFEDSKCRDKNKLASNENP